jgi:hypothetical protein
MMITINLADGLTLHVDPDKFTLKGGLSLELSEQWSNDLLYTLDLNVRDLLEENDTKVQNIVELRTK